MIIPNDYSDGCSNDYSVDDYSDGCSNDYSVDDVQIVIIQIVILLMIIPNSYYLEDDIQIVIVQTVILLVIIQMIAELLHKIKIHN